MAKQEPDDCASKKPWSEIISGSLKKIIWKGADGLGEEAGRSVGKLLFYGVLGLIGLWLVSTAIAQFTDILGGWLDWIPNPFSWFSGDEVNITPAEQPAVTQEESSSEPGPICSRWTTFNPFCD